MLNSTEKKKSVKFANMDMDKFKFDFQLFVPSEKEIDNLPDDKRKEA